MKKFISIIIVCFLALLLVGCGDKDKKEENKELKRVEETIKALYSNEDKLVYDNGGLYKIVIYYDGNKVTGIENYYEYSNEEEAKSKLEETKELLKNEENVKSVLKSGKFVVTVYNNNEYKDETVENIQNTYVSLKPVYEK